MKKVIIIVCLLSLGCGHQTVVQPVQNCFGNGPCNQDNRLEIQQNVSPTISPNVNVQSSWSTTDTVRLVSWSGVATSGAVSLGLLREWSKEQDSSIKRDYLIGASVTTGVFLVVGLASYLFDRKNNSNNYAAMPWLTF